MIYLYKRGSTYVLFSAEHEILVGYNINAVISLRESMGTLAPSFILYLWMVAGVLELTTYVCTITRRSYETPKWLVYIEL